MTDGSAPNPPSAALISTNPGATPIALGSVRCPSQPDQQFARHRMSASLWSTQNSGDSWTPVLGGGLNH